jgi:hypothetical protein
MDFSRPSAATVTPVTQSIAPVQFDQTADRVIFIDFGEEWFGNLQITLTEQQAAEIKPGDRIAVSVGEVLSGPRQIESKPGRSVRYYSKAINLHRDQTIYTLPLTKADVRLMPASVGPVMPFRYAQIDNAPAGLKPEQVCIRAVHAPFDESAAQFDCSDPRLTAIWKLCHHTIEATSFAGLFVDGDRERTPYEADAFINQLGWYCSTTDPAVPRDTWRYLLQHPTWPTEWCMFEVLLAWNDYQYTGDSHALSEDYEQLEPRTLMALERPDGLISTVDPPVPRSLLQSLHEKRLTDIVDWPAGERDGYEMRPINTVVNAFHVIALRRLSQIARVLQKPSDADRLDAAAQHALRAFNARLLDSTTGLYVDGESSGHSSIHANFFPFAFGLVPPERRSNVAKFLAAHPMSASVYGAQFFLEALFDSSQADRAIALMTAPGDRSWTHMLDCNATLTWEAWDRRYKNNLDLNHAWGAAPANLIPRKLMGIEPLEPGFKKILICPNPGSLTWAQMRVPTVRGSVFVRVERKDGYQITVEVPPGTTAMLGLPLASPAQTITLDDLPVTPDRTADGAFVDSVPPGHHRLRVR